jgi:hypothetical protein
MAPPGAARAFLVCELIASVLLSREHLVTYPGLLTRPQIRPQPLAVDRAMTCLLMCISELPSPFHQFGLLVALASA